jgi:hypothetical protein
MGLMERNHGSGFFTMPILLTVSITALTVIIGFIALDNGITIIF